MRRNESWETMRCRLCERVAEPVSILLQLESQTLSTQLAVLLVLSSLSCEERLRPICDWPCKPLPERLNSAWEAGSPLLTLSSLRVECQQILLQGSSSALKRF